MGIVEDDLVSFGLSTFEDCRIERNSDGTVHLHMDGLRLEFTRAEFAEFAAAVRRARGELEDLKDATHGVTAESAR